MDTWNTPQDKQCDRPADAVESTNVSDPSHIDEQRDKSSGKRIRAQDVDENSKKVSRVQVIDMRLEELKARDKQLVRAIRLAAIEKRFMEIENTEQELGTERKKGKPHEEDDIASDTEPDVIKRARAFVWRATRSGMTLNLSIKKAIKIFGASAVEAIVREVAQLDETYGPGVVEPVHSASLTAQEREATISSHIFVREKLNALGKVEKVKAKIVPEGHMQDASMYAGRSAPTGATDSIMILAAIAAKEERSVGKLDFPGAILNAPIPEIGPTTHMRLNTVLMDILVRLDPKYVLYLRPSGSMVCKLNKTLYGTLIAARQWHGKVSGLFARMGFKANPNDACVFNRDSTTMIIHLDDVMIMSESDRAVKRVMKEIADRWGSKPGNNCETGKQIDFLRIFDNFGKKRVVTLSMDGYVAGLLEESGMRGTARSPASRTLYEVHGDTLALDAREAKRFHTLVCKLLYLAKRVRPDLLTTVTVLTTRTDNPTKDDDKKLERALKYLNDTRDLHLTLGAAKENTIT
ncbi:Copia protein [Porphyridium purpureum]|uniref:Copia protein n=1 Tax=Porphyridium purpureum TaxID=35688 RepID=A0A5J4YQ22_PORPP|nr:Copia protein [Porphyridium purpureum]|eukprot:POR6438..scf296_7